MNNNFKVVPQAKPQSGSLTILVTGAGRGIGFELVKQYSEAYESNIVIAAVRDTSAASPLSDFATTHPNVHIIPMDTSSEESIKTSVQHIPPSVTHIDYLWNNAGIMGKPASVRETTSAGFNEVLNINVIGPFLVVGAYQHLLLKAPEPKVINVSSGLGSSTLASSVAQWGTIPYGASKAALNFVNNALKTAIPEVTFLSVSPGWVATDMGGSFGTVAPVTTFDSVSGLRELAQSKTKEDSGQFVDVITGQIYPY